MKPDKGVLFVVTGPSGTGKTTIINSVLPNLEHFQFSVSATTRDARPNEEHGEDYYFLSKPEFETNIKANRFLEWAEVFGNYYGTPSIPVEQALNSGTSILLDVDPQGAKQVAEKGEDAVFIFISPPGPKDLETRLRGRGTESEEVLRKRLGEAKACLKIAGRFDYFLVNDDLETAKETLRAILLAETFRSSKRVRQMHTVRGAFMNRDGELRDLFD